MISLLWQVQYHKSTISIYAGLKWNELKVAPGTKCDLCRFIKTPLKYYINDIYKYSAYHICQQCYEYVLRRNVIGKKFNKYMIIRPINNSDVPCEFCPNCATWKSSLSGEIHDYLYMTVAYICNDCADNKFKY
jgi:hypothetical protein